MARYTRKYGAVQPGLKWGPFTTRLPGIHVNISWPEVLQGGLIAVATGAAAAPILMEYFGVSFTVAWSVTLIQLLWVWVHTMLFGDPYSPGWITPALPLVLVFLAGFAPGVEAIHATMAVMINVTILFLFFGLTGLGEKFNRMVPTVLKSGIIMGAAIAAFQGELERVREMPASLITAWVVVLVLLYSIPFSKIKAVKIKTLLAANALLVAFIAAAIAGVISGEMSFEIQWGIFVPQVGEIIQQLTPWGVGLPSWDMIVTAIPLALMIYIVVFGDLLVADSLLKSADKARNDEKIDIDHTRTHYSLAIRNMGHMMTGGAFPPLHGPIWTGVQVYIIERYKKGRAYLDSIYSGTINWYWLAIPLVFLMPIIGIMTPLLPVALSLPLLLTGFACAYLSMSMVYDNLTRGMALAIGMITALEGPAWGLGVGVVLYIVLIGIERMKNE